MAQTRRYVPNQQLDLEQILHEAQYRWLRPTEICEILRNYQKFHLTPDPPLRPPAGSLFLFDRKALRYFRKDGHRWRKKKDGKTVKEAHEKLKAGSIDVLHCYYAHGEDNENFQRRSYWMLDGQLEHIVLVHYREVKEGYKSGIAHLVADPGSQIESSQTSSARSLAQANSPGLTAQTSHASSPNKIDWNGQALSSEFEDVDSGHGSGAASLAQPIYASMLQNASLVAASVAGLPELPIHPPGSWFTESKINNGTGSSMWPQIDNSRRNAFSVVDQYQKFYVGQPSGADSTVANIGNRGDKVFTDIDVHAVTTSSEGSPQVPLEHDFSLINNQHHNCSVPDATVSQAEIKPKEELGQLKKLDSFGRWMDQEIGGDCDDSLMASDSGNYWNTLDAENGDKEVSSLSRHMQLEMDSLGPSLSQEQLFSIRDFSPEWGYSGVETKVLIIGMFLGTKKLSVDTKWGCMFGEIEVPAEVLTDNVIRCQAPSHAAGRVPFYITCSNRLACSEVREFEYHEKPSKACLACKIAPEEVVRLQTRLAKLAYLDPDRKLLDCSIKDCDKCKSKKSIYSMRGDSEKDWGRDGEISIVIVGDCPSSRDKLIQNLLRDRLCEWLVWKIHEGEGLHVIDDAGQGVIHLAAALGYEWAMRPIIAAGMSPNFRDARGRTALHWASYFGSAAIAFTVGLLVSWRVSIVMIAIQPLNIGCFYSRSVLMKSLSEKAKKAQSEGSQLASEATTNHRTITAFSSQNRILDLFKETMKGPKKESIKQSWFSGIGLFSSQFLTTASITLTFWYAGRIMHQGLVSPKQLFQAFFLLMSTGKSIADAGSMTADIAKGGSAIKTIFTILDRKSAIDPEDPNSLKDREPTRGSIEFKTVFFSYPSRPDQMIFKGLSLKIEAGKTMALVGQSGSGKSTIIGLIERFYDPQSGSIMVDEQDVKSYNLRKLREETVIALVKLGAAPGAVEDPTPSFPGGQTAADLASCRGHKGISGYLAEAHLTSHLSSLIINEKGIDNVAAALAAEKATETAAQIGVQSDRLAAGQLSLRGSLAAVRKSAHAAALIQQAFRVRSFRHRQSTQSSDDVSEVSVDLVALGSLNKVPKMSHFEDYLHFAAVKIQQKYRGWKGRRDFLKIRNRIVKLQAHVRGHQVRKQYKKFIWSVSIVEKAILRWRRKGSGLRGFRVGNTTANVTSENEKMDEYEFLRIGRKQKFAGVEKALERVKSMVRNPEARDQYMRMVAKFENFKVFDEGSTAASQGESSLKSTTENNYLHASVPDQ